MSRCLETYLDQSEAEAVLRCHPGRNRRRLGGITPAGIAIYCRECGEDHLLTWEDARDLVNKIREAAEIKVALLAAMR